MTTVWHGPAAWESPEPRRYGPVARVAVMSDVHANVAALTAVLADIEAAGADLIVSCGDLTWGSHPDETIALMRGTMSLVWKVRPITTIDATMSSWWSRPAMPSRGTKPT